MEEGVGREGLDPHPSPWPSRGTRRHQAVCLENRLTISGRSRVRGHPYTVLLLWRWNRHLPLLPAGVKIEKPTREPVQLHITSDIGMPRPCDRWTKERACVLRTPLLPPCSPGSLLRRVIFIPSALSERSEEKGREEEKRCNESKTVAIDSYLAPWMQRWANKWNAGLRKQVEARIFERFLEGSWSKGFFFFWCQEGFRHLQQDCVSRIYSHRSYIYITLDKRILGKERKLKKIEYYGQYQFASLLVHLLRVEDLYPLWRGSYSVGE